MIIQKIKHSIHICQNRPFRFPFFLYFHSVFCLASFVHRDGISKNEKRHYLKAFTRKIANTFFVRQREFRLITNILSGLLLVSLLIACSPGPKQSPSGLTVATNEFSTIPIKPDSDQSFTPKKDTKSNDCPALDSQLYQLSQSANAAQDATALGFQVKEGAVQVLIVMVDENTDFLESFAIEPGTQSGSKIQAYVKFEDLCKLANDDSVLAIRPVAQLIN